MNRSVLSALVVILGLSAWMWSGANEAPQQEIVPQAENKPAMKVQVVQSKASSVHRIATIQGQVEAGRLVQVKAEIEGRVEKILAEEGQRVNDDETLVKLSDDYRPAQLAEAKARLRQRLSDLQASQKLKRRGLQAENRLVADQAEVESARAQLAQAQFQLDHTFINAPFAGVLNKRVVEHGDFVEKGQVIAEVVDDQQLIVTGQVPQSQVGLLQLGQSVDIRLINQQTYSGRLTFISSTADTSTRSYRVEVEIANPKKQRLIGLSATLFLPLGEYQGHWVASSLLSLDAEGKLLVKQLVADNRVQAKTVEIIRTDEDGFWIDGLAKNVTLISLGQNFVSDGDLVDPSLKVAGVNQ